MRKLKKNRLAIIFFHSIIVFFLLLHVSSYLFLFMSISFIQIITFPDMSLHSKSLFHGIPGHGQTLNILNIQATYSRLHQHYIQVYVVFFLFWVCALSQCSVITAMFVLRDYSWRVWILSVKSRLVACRANTLPVVPSLWTFAIFLYTTL